MLEKLFNDLVASNEALIDKFKKYLDASNYDGKRNFKTWLGELVKAMDQLESALADTKDKRIAMGKALDDFVKMQGPNISANKAAVETVSRISLVMADIHTNIETIKVHIKKYKA